MEHQDFTDAASILLSLYMDKLQHSINEILPVKIGKIEVGMGGEWYIPLTGGRVLYATPFWEMGEGLPVSLDNEEDGDTIKNAQLPFEITGDLKKDAQTYAMTINIFLSMVD